MRKCVLFLSVILLLCVMVVLCFRDVSIYPASIEEADQCCSEVEKTMTELKTVHAETVDITDEEFDKRIRMRSDAEFYHITERTVPNTRQCLAVLASLDWENDLALSNVQKITFFTNPVLWDCSLGDFIVCVPLTTLPKPLSDLLDGGEYMQAELNAVCSSSFAVKRLILSVYSKNENVTFATITLYLE